MSALNYTRRDFLKVTGVGASALAVQGCMKAARSSLINKSENKPNIVFIFSDQHRGDTLGSVGYPVIRTPHLDRIASERPTSGWE